MNILMITPYLPYPIVSGGQIRTYNLLKHLSKKHNITLMSFVREHNEQQYIPELEKFCQKVVTFKRTAKAWHPRNILMAGLTMNPFVVCLYLYQQVKQAIREELANGNYDLIHAETFYVMPNIPKDTQVPILLVEQVIEYLVYQRFTERLPAYALLLKPLLYLDVAKIKQKEQYYWKYASALAAMSPEDRDYMLELEPQLHIDVIANGVDIDHFASTKKITHKRPTVIFIGNFKWLPNKEAAKFLVNQVWPQVKRTMPDSRLQIFGFNPTSEVTALGKNKGVEVKGFIPDIRDAYAGADVLLAPILNGRGTKYKILEAMATKTPIVGTSLAVEGIDIKNGIHALVSDSPQQLARDTVKILMNKSMGKQLSQAAFKLVKDIYGWQGIATELDNVYQRIGKK
jgi:glycosyltransferase involved in cell wall biosynthesis